MYNFNAVRKHTVLEATAIIANIKQKWDNLKDWPDYRGHSEPSDYPRYLHVSALCGVREETDALTGVKTQVAWTNKGVTLNTGRNAAKRAARLSYKKPKNESANTA